LKARLRETARELIADRDIVIHDEESYGTG
jgi:hypothetical protein